MKRDSFRVLFFLKKTRLLKNGEASVCMRITVNGTRVENNIRKSIDPALWSQAKETARGKSRRACDLNTYIEEARIKLYQIFCELEQQNRPVTAHLLQELFFGQEKPEEVRTLLGTMQEHNDQCRALVGTDYALITVRRYESCRRYLAELIRQRYGKEDLPLAEVNGELVGNVFIFAAFTGMAFTDVQQLKPEHLVADIHGKIWIRKARQKTKNMCNILLLDIPQEILHKYANHPACRKKGVLLPVPCNQKMNSYLKEIADICMIRKNLTTHCARHSYATSVCLANGVSLENVAKMLGHSNIKMTQHYARVLDSSILRDMNHVQAALSSSM